MQVLDLANNLHVSAYYSGIDPTATNMALKQQLQALVSVKTELTYDDAWTAFASVDKFLEGYPCSSDLSMIPDIYSGYCWKPVKITPGGECGNYAKEGDCFNREHSWPKSWFGGFDYGDGAQVDLFELYPSDGYVNGLRGNLPFCDVDRSRITYQSTNGSLIGYCNSTEYNGKGFEPADYLKGDLARSYFYLSVAYMNDWTCCDDVGVQYWNIKLWMETVLRNWHALDPVNDQERSRNEEIYQNWQHNRNPFIDNPQWVNQINDF
jgi:endonuclease I